MWDLVEHAARGIPRDNGIDPCGIQVACNGLGAGESGWRRDMAQQLLVEVVGGQRVDREFFERRCRDG